MEAERAVSSDLKGIVEGGQSVLSGIDGEADVWKRVQVGAVSA